MSERRRQGPDFIHGCFVTGTDTGCGKTEMTLGLMAAWQGLGARVQGMKPVASGCSPGPEGPRSPDALAIQAQGSTRAPYATVNPFAFEPPIAPHIAAGEAGTQIELAVIEAAYAALRPNADVIVVEGVGGWRVPLGPSLFVGDIPLALQLPVVLVVGLKLGCLNHALLTVEGIRASGACLAGWIANQIDPEMLARDASLATLGALIDAPCIGVVPWLASPAAAGVAGHLQPGALRV